MIDLLSNSERDAVAWRLGETPDQGEAPPDLDRCPRCGQPIQELVWGQTNCPNCGLHFECC